MQQKGHNLLHRDEYASVFGGDVTLQLMYNLLQISYSAQLPKDDLMDCNLTLSLNVAKTRT